MRVAINAVNLDHSERSGLLVYVENLLIKLAEIDSKNDYFLLFNSLSRKGYQMPGPNKHNFTKKVLRVPDTQFTFKDLFLNKYIFPNFLYRNHCNIFHAPSGYSLPDINNKIRKVLTIHDLRSLKIDDKIYPQNIKSLKNAVAKADVCITVSHSSKQDIAEHLKVPLNKIRVTYLGADDRFKPAEIAEKQLIKEKYGISDKYIFSLGQVPRKNIKRLIKAFNIFKFKDDFLLVLGGVQAKAPWSREYFDLVNELKLKNRVRFIGQIPFEDLPLLYSASELFVFPSLYEGFGIPVLEAMSCGVPVITSNVSSLPEIGEKAALYVDPYKEEDIADKMEKLVGDDSLKREMIQIGLERAREFSWVKMARETLKIYEEVANC